MKKISLLCLILFMFGCGEEYYNGKIDELKKEKKSLSTEVSLLSSNVNDLENKKETLNKSYLELKKEVDVLNAKLEGKKILYILRLEVSTSRFTLDMEEMLKDAMNAVEFEIPVDESFYNKCLIGEKLVNKFRAGSFVMSGSMGSNNVKVIDKKRVIVDE